MQAPPFAFLSVYLSRAMNFYLLPQVLVLLEGISVLRLIIISFWGRIFWERLETSEILDWLSGFIVERGVSSKWQLIVSFLCFPLWLLSE